MQSRYFFQKANSKRYKIKHIKLLIKFLVAAIFNSGFNFVLFNLIFFSTDFQLLIFSYISSSFFVTILAYYINKNYVFEKHKVTKKNIFSFFFTEFFLTLMTVLFYKFFEIYLPLTTILSVAMIFSIRIILTFILYKIYVFKS